MTAALQEEIKNLEKNREYVCGLRDKLIAGLKKIPHSRLNGDEKRRLAGNVNLCFEGIEGESLLLFLDDMASPQARVARARPARSILAMFCWR